MVLLRLAFALTILLTVPATAQTDLTGTWKADVKWKWLLTCCTEVVFDLKADGKTLGGIAHMSSWPGDSLVSEGVIDGDRVSFVATSTVTSSSGFLRMWFDGTVVGDTLKLTMISGYTHEPKPQGAQKWELEAKRVAPIPKP